MLAKSTLWLQRRLAFGLVLGACAGIGAACYTGFGSVGAFCESTADCGPEQACENSVCGVCGNDVVDPGELCMAPADEIQLGASIRTVVHADLDEDGDTDLLAATNSSCVELNGPCWYLHILLNRGDGTLDSARSDPFAGQLESVAVVPLDAVDGVDAALTIQSAAFVTVVFNVFSPDAQTIQLDTPAPARSVRAADLNADDIVDVIAASDAGPDGGSISIFEGLGAGEFELPRSIESGPAPWIGPIVDLDLDGDRDLIVANVTQDTVRILLNQGDGTFVTSQTLATGAQPVFLTIADTDADQRPELIIANSLDASLTIYRAMGDGSYGDRQDLPTGPRPVFIEVGDINADERADLIVANADDDKLSIYLGRDNGFPDRVEFDVASTPTWVVRDDFNHDDHPDLAVAAGSSLAFSFARP